MNNHTKRALHYTASLAAIIVGLIVVLGIWKWKTGASWNGYTVNYCSYLLQYCGTDMRITLKEAAGNWVVYGLIPTLFFLWLAFIQAKEAYVKKSVMHGMGYFLPLFIVSILMQGLVALILPGVTSIEYSAKFYPANFFMEHQVITLLTVGTLGLILEICSLQFLSRQANKK